MRRVFTVLTSIAAVTAIGILDYKIGAEISVKVLYLAPIFLVTWYNGKVSGIFISLLSAIALLLALLYGGRTYSHALTPYWNAIVELMFFVIYAFILSKLRRNMELEKSLSRLDFLTGIPNLKAFHELGMKEIERCRRNNCKVSVAYMDCDNFKQINDTFGHHVGNKLINSIAKTIQKSIRNIDVAARLSGDEFAIILPNADAESSKLIMDRVLKSLSNVVEKENWTVTFSVGVVLFNNLDYSLDQMLEIADEIMYQVKKSGKNMVKYEVID